MNIENETTQIDVKTTLIRGFNNKCPNCAKGKLLKNYITPHNECSYCHLNYTPLRADDGPAWATILITGHLSMPFAFWLLGYSELSTLTTILILISLVIAMSAIILPRAKGIFMAILWLTQQKEVTQE